MNFASNSLSKAQRVELISLTAFGLALRVFFALYSGYVEEDAYITFQFARNLAAGQGFVYNPGEAIYGSTTPLLTLLLAGWMALGGEPVLGARLLGLAGAAAYLSLTWAALVRLGVPRVGRVCAVGLLACAPRLAALDLAGMEQPLVLAFMAASAWAGLRGRWGWAGVWGGLLLWTRLDTGLWLALLGAAAIWQRRAAGGLRFAGAAAGIYLPWVVYASAVFGSPIPHTVTAKWAAYAHSGAVPIHTGWKPALDAFFLFRTTHPLLYISLALSAGLFVLAGWGAAALAGGLLFAAYGEAALGVERKLALVFAAAGGLAFWAGRRPWAAAVRWAALGWLALAFAGTAGFTLRTTAVTLREVQSVRHEASLKAVGLWLNRHTPLDARVLLEPLGYAGYYAQRVMLDEVGLVTPAVVALKRSGVTDTYEALDALRPDYVLLHCDDALRWAERDPQPENRLTRAFRLAAEINPLGFDPRDAETRGRNSCYQIWERYP
ncbi:hypothetical protein LSAC_00866 [Levilinea saccharolytica]|nr:hypothetical protein LSAC_00866 [Levilinea saccharolytica]